MSCWPERSGFWVAWALTPPPLPSHILDKKFRPRPERYHLVVIVVGVGRMTTAAGGGGHCGTAELLSLVRERVRPRQPSSHHPPHSAPASIHPSDSHSLANYRGFSAPDILDASVNTLI